VEKMKCNPTIVATLAGWGIMASKNKEAAVAARHG
jgi:hypothetical protein